MNRWLISAAAAVVTAAGGGVATLSFFNSSSLPATCKSYPAPQAPLKTVLHSGVFDPADIKDPVLSVRLAPDLVERADYFVEYLDQSKRLVSREALDPAELKILAPPNSDSRLIDLAGIEFNTSLGSPRIAIEAPVAKADKPLLGAAAKVSARGAGPLNVINPLIGPNRTIGQPLGEGGGLTQAHADLMRNSVVLILNTTTGEVCNGTHVGDGKILTAGHCIGAKQLVLFGSTWHTGKEFRGEVVCPVQAATVSGRPSASAPSRQMDIGYLQVSADFAMMPEAARFSAAKISVDRREPSPASYNLVAIWTGARQPAALEEGGKAYSPDWLQKQLFRPPSTPPADPDFAWCQSVQSQVQDDCVANQHSNVSAAGWVHRCPVVAGLSGAPLFDASASEPAVVAVVSGDSAKRLDNCATPVFFSSSF